MSEASDHFKKLSEKNWRVLEIEHLDEWQVKRRIRQIDRAYLMYEIVRRNFSTLEKMRNDLIKMLPEPEPNPHLNLTPADPTEGV